MSLNRWLSLSLILSGACGDVEKDHDHDHENEVITTVALTFTPAMGGDPLAFEWADPEADGSPVIDEIILSDADDYAVTVSFLNGLESPAEDITEEVRDESDEHQVFFTGSGVSSEATGENAAAVVQFAYADEDANGSPVGLEADVTTLMPGAGELIVTLRHMPAEGGEPVKTASTAADVAGDGFSSIGGSNDVQVTFPISVE
jgi:hypothetical protein